MTTTVDLYDLHCEACGAARATEGERVCTATRESHELLATLTRLARAGLVPLPERVAQRLAAGGADVAYVPLVARPPAFGHAAARAVALDACQFADDGWPALQALLLIQQLCERDGVPWWFALLSAGASAAALDDAMPAWWRCGRPAVPNAGTLMYRDEGPIFIGSIVNRPAAAKVPVGTRFFALDLLQESGRLSVTVSRRDGIVWTPARTPDVDDVLPPDPRRPTP